ncbi:MAG: DNA double-strand break repair nuclease NurA [Caldisericota bacterium]|nr:DNA double-strand break repair nuclease NurA [Caldisericota bacterium]
MLKIEKILPEMKNAVKESKDLQVIKKDLIERALEILKDVSASEIEIKRNFMHVNFPVATPLSNPLDKIHADVDMQDYIVVATDGSEIPIDFDFPLYYYVVNIGEISIKYGDTPYFFANSVPKMFYTEKDLFVDMGGQKMMIKGEVLDSKMLLEESISLSSLLEKTKNENIPVISLLDGTLIQWEVKDRNEQFKQEFINRFQLLFQKSQELNIPTAGYISGSRSKDVTGIVKLQITSSEKKTSNEDVKQFDILQDTDIFGRLLKSGERSALFRSNAPILRYYTAPIFFFYFNVGSEIARVEIPAFIAHDKQKIDLLHKLLLSQTEKGMGYPVALKEAHEQAVIHAYEKSALRQIFSELLQKDGISIQENNKSFFKKMRGI